MGKVSSLTTEAEFELHPKVGLGQSLTLYLKKNNKCTEMSKYKILLEKSETILYH